VAEVRESPDGAPQSATDTPAHRAKNAKSSGSSERSAAREAPGPRAPLLRARAQCPARHSGGAWRGIATPRRGAAPGDAAPAFTPSTPAGRGGAATYLFRFGKTSSIRPYSLACVALR
jgi:hypothetical protein